MKKVIKRVVKKPIYIKTEVFDINKKNDKKKPQKEIIPQKENTHYENMKKIFQKEKGDNNMFNIPEGISLDRLPDDASEMLRIVRIGNYDICPCIGKHVRSTGQIGRFEMLGTNWDEQSHSFRIRFKVIP